MKNRTAHIRWWAKRIDRPGVVPSNGELGIPNREYVTNEDRSVVLDPEKLALVTDPHVAVALRLEAAFGLRREEAIKFASARDDRGDRIRLKGSTTKGGRPREVPVRNEAQRSLLDEVRRLVGSGALIPPDRNYRQQLKVYESQTREAGLYRMHGLRHRYAQTRYEELTGWKAPAAGGPSQRSLTGARRRIDTAARRAIAEELGHSRWYPCRRESTGDERLRGRSYRRPMARYQYAQIGAVAINVDAHGNRGLVIEIDEGDAKYTMQIAVPASHAMEFAMEVSRSSSELTR